MRYPVLLLFCCLLFTRPGYAQTCTGSLGDPIVNVDFGSGSGAIGPALGTDPLGKPLTTYPYAAGYPTDGYYTITNNTQVLNHPTWWNTTDHTKNQGGYMMVVNASSSPGVFYQQTVNSLCPGTTYEFAVWVMNLATASVPGKPNITFQITNSAGVVIGSYNTQNIPESSSAVWIQYAMQFTTPPGNGTVTLTIANNGPGGNGNDIALDDITFRPCGPVINSNFVISSGSSANGCAGTAQSFTMSTQVAGGYSSPMYQWQVNNNGTWTDIPGATTQTYTASFTAAAAVAGTYQYRMASANGTNISSPTCRVVSNVLTLTINPLPAINVLRPVVTVCQGERFSQTLTNADPNSTYTWTKQGGGFAPQSPNLLIANTQFSDAGTYVITVVNAAGCTLTETVQLVVNPKVTAAVASNNVSICEGDNVQLSASGGSTYKWSPAVGLSNADIANPVASPAGTTTYTVTVSNASGCTDVAQVVVNVTNKPVVKAGNDQKMTEGQTITLNGSVDNRAATYYWTPSAGLSDPNSLHPTANPTEDITYTLHAATGAPCNFSVTDDVFIRVYKKVVVPNTFTPNGDGVNDTWNITALETYPESYTQVFNRLGRVVYQSRGYTKPWDGKMNGSPLPEGTYYYKIELKPGTVLAGWIAIVR